MTFLELCQRLHQEVGAAGNGPANVAGQSGEYARLIGWVQTAWREIQLERVDWRFAWAQGEIEVFDEFRTYELPDDFSEWRKHTLRLEGESLRVAEWDDFQTVYREPTGNGPRVATIAPNRVVHLDDFPRQSSSALTFEYWRTPQTLDSNNDAPRLPERYHMAIIYRAMLQYGLYENAPEVVQQASANYREVMMRVAATELPPINTGEALA